MSLLAGQRTKSSLRNLNVKVNVGLPPDAVYNIVTDLENKRVCKNIKVGGICSSTISFRFYQ
jgi:hypothetical protein